MNSLEMKKRAFMAAVTRNYGFVRVKSGSLPLTLESCIQANLINYKISGNTGKNLLDFPEAFTFEGFVSRTVNIPAGKYTVSWGSSVLGGEDKPTLRLRDNAKSLPFAAQGGSWTVTLTQPETIVYLYSNGYSVNDSKGVTSTVNQLMFESGEAATEYEPYKCVGDLDSASGKYKIPVTVSGENLSNAQTTNIFISTPLKIGESIEYKNGDLPPIAVSEGTNIINVGTEVSPSAFEAEYYSNIKEE